MAEWLVDTGIGEGRRVLVDGGAIVQAHLMRDDGRPPAGAVLDARLGRRLANGRAEARLAAPFADAAVILQRVPAGLTEGGALRLRITREAIPERGDWRPAQAEPSDLAPDSAGALDGTVRASGLPVNDGPDAALRIEAAGWAELVEEARGGDIAFAGGRLRVAVTPAMTLFDVDGDLPAAELAMAGARAAALAIRRLDIGGSIGIDLPTVADRAVRQAVAEQVDRWLPQPFERTAMNGFGFLQIVRRRERASLPELMQGDAARAAAFQLLRAVPQAQGAGARTMVAHPRLMALLAARPDWLERAARQVGAPVRLRADDRLAIWAGHVEVEHN